MEDKMARIWKIGSRWGNRSVLDLFVDYGCVFLGEGDSPQRIGHYWEVHKDDLFIISDGTTPVALAKACGDFMTYADSGLKFTSRDEKDFIDDDVRLCKAEIVLLTAAERSYNWRIDTRKRFCAHKPNSVDAFDVWQRYQEVYNNSAEFNISSDSWHLFESNEIYAEPGVFSPNRRYRIPIYQRPYSWNEKELRHLLEDLNQALKNQEPVFMGTMQLSSSIPLNSDGTKKAYDLIDGQQRITTFIILLTLLQKRLNLPDKIDFQRTLRTTINQGEAQRNLDEFWQYSNEVWQDNDEGRLIPDNRNPYIRNAIILCGLLKEEYFDGKEGNPTLEQLWDFLQENILFVVIETRAGLSKTLKIFNTINTAGLDLGMEDLFKIRFYEYRKWCGDQDNVFDEISEVYAAIDAYNREHPHTLISMRTLLATYQRILVAKYNLNTAAYNMGCERFFEMFFDTVLGVRTWPDFEKSCKGQKNQLTIEDLTRLLDCFKARHRHENTNYDFRIMNRMFWETRYGYAWDFNVIALFFEKISEDQFGEFTTKLFKLLVPSSLRFAKRIYAVDNELLNLLKKLAANGISAVDALDAYFESGHFAGYNMANQIREASTLQITGYPKWKMLICRLAEYLKHDVKSAELYTKLFEIAIDIEHIQSYTDEKDREQVWNEWGEELNRLGNLTLLERSANRSIANVKEKKMEFYAKSRFASVQELKDKLAGWNKEQAVNRREKITQLLCDYLLQK